MILVHFFNAMNDNYDVKMNWSSYRPAIERIFDKDARFQAKLYSLVCGFVNISEIHRLYEVEPTIIK